MKQEYIPDNFNRIIEANKGIIYKVANSYCTNAEDRKDLVQEIIVQLWRSFDRYDDQFKFSTWMYRIALNVSISFYGKEKKRANFSRPVSDSVLNIPEDNDLDEIDPNLAHLKKFISELKVLDRAIILLYLEEKSQNEIGDILGLSSTNVSTKINRIKNKLKHKFSIIKNK